MPFGIELRTAVVHEVIWHPQMPPKTIEPVGRAMIGVRYGLFSFFCWSVLLVAQIQQGDQCFEVIGAGCSKDLPVGVRHALKLGVVQRI